MSDKPPQTLEEYVLAIQKLDPEFTASDDFSHGWDGGFAAGVASQQPDGLAKALERCERELAEKDREIERLTSLLFEFVPLDQYNAAQAALEEK